MSAALVWFKRDLRIHDHRPLAEAADSGNPLICLYVIEPDYWQLPQTSGRQYAFLRETLESLSAALNAKGGRLVVRVGDAVETLKALHGDHGLSSVHAHQETGLDWTYQRDNAVAKFLKSANIPFHEHRQHGVIRGLKTRNGWAKKWDRFMDEPVTPAPDALDCLDVDSETIPDADVLGLRPDPCPDRQEGGRRAAVSDLKSFFDGRGRYYRKEMSSPEPARTACSRLSAHFSLGALSIREAYQGAKRAMEAKKSEGDSAYTKSIDSFISRLHWHCHFMQKLEDEPEIEWRDLHPAYRDARPAADEQTVTAWIEGQTGFPFIDACMRWLKAEGWLNFRMRAMVMAFSSYHLWQHWKQPSCALARRFTDFEAGIHYSQSQMQSGTTGMNTPRIYNPVKQSYDQDQDGAFIRRWVPELKELSDSFIHEPWKAPGDVLEKAGITLGEDYPQRIVDHESAAREARSKIAKIRADQDHREEAKALQNKHGSRKSGMRRRGSNAQRKHAKKEDADTAQSRFDF